MRDWWIMWTYLGNFSEKPIKVQTRTPDEAAAQVARIFSDDFKRKGTIYVYSRPPTIVIRDGKRVEIGENRGLL